MNFPWEESPLDTWFIVCLNHRVVFKATATCEKHIFCAMTKGSHVIEEHGPDAYSVFQSLKRQAEAWDKRFREVMGGMDG